MRKHRLGGREKQTQQGAREREREKKEEIRSQDLKLAGVRWIQ
jgi:hypothetical protein